MKPKPNRKAETMSEAKLSKAELRQFTGSEQWYRHGLVRTVLFTDGAKYVADQGGAYWLLDEIALAQRGDPRVAAEEFQVWKLAVKPGRTATLTCDDGNGNIVSPRATQTKIRAAMPDNASLCELTHIHAHAFGIESVVAGKFETAC
jgi:hypothetical protein